MKCLKCGKNSLYRERSGGKCSGCGQKFVFEPKSGDLFTDTGFSKALDHVSQGNSLSFQRRQLFYELARMRMKRPGAVASKLGRTIATGFGGVMLGIFLAIWFGNMLRFVPMFWVMLGLYIAVWAAIMATVWIRTDPTLLSLDPIMAERGLAKWQASKGQIAGLMTKPLALKAPKGEKDVLDYAVERAIICDHHEVVDFLLANNFHIEQKCAILSYGGHPREHFEAVRTMLRKNTSLNVFVLHNASSNGCKLYHDLVSHKEWFPGSQRVFDIGLHPRHAKHFKGLWQKASTQPEGPVPGYSPEEMAWLSKYKLELLAVPPARLLRLLQNVLNGHTRSVADAYANGDSGSSGGDMFMVSSGYDGGSDDDFG